MKDNLHRADTWDMWSDDADWLSVDGLRHSIRPRSRASQGLIPARGGDVLTGLTARHPAPEGTEPRGDGVDARSDAVVPLEAEKTKRDDVIDAAPEAPEVEVETVREAPVDASAVPVDETLPHAIAETSDVEISDETDPEEPAETIAEEPARTTVTPARVTRAALPRTVAEPAVVARQEMPQWDDLPRVAAGRNRPQVVPVVDAQRDSLSAQAFDLLRTRLRQTTREHGWVNIAVTAPTRGCGSTFTALNLALSLSRIPGSRTVLMDLNLRNPGLARALDIDATGDMRDYLGGHVAMRDHLQRVSDTLALGLNADRDDDAAETLQHPAVGRTLDRMRAALRPEMVIYDLPPMLGHDDVSAFLPHLDGVLLVSDGTRTMGRQLAECEKMLDGRVPLLGVVLNRARADSLRRHR